MIPDRFRGIFFSGIEVNDGNRAAVESMKNFVSDPKSFTRKGKGVLLLGEPGTGKTALMCAALNEIRDANIKGRRADQFFETTGFTFETVEYFIDTKRRAMKFDDVDTLMDVSRRDKDIIALDDIGAEHSTEWGKSAISNLIDYLYRERFSLFASTNCGEAALTEQIGERSVDRLREMCVWRPLTCPSWRGQSDNGK